MTAVLAELASRRLKLALVDGGPAAGKCIARLRAVLDHVDVGAAATAGDRPGADGPLVLEPVGTPLLLTALDVLCWPEAGVDIVDWLSLAAADRSVIAAWPGKITSNRLQYSEPGRADHIDRALPDVLVLRPVDAQFDDVPFTIERTR